MPFVVHRMEIKVSHNSVLAWVFYYLFYLFFMYDKILINFIIT